MGLLDKILPGKRHDDKPSTVAFQSFTDYAPAFSTYNGSVYEQALTRSAIHAFANACSKLCPEHHGTAKLRLTRAFETSPNAYTTWSRFLYRTATMYECDATVAIVPSFSKDGETINGIWNLKFDFAEIVEVAGEPWVRFSLPNGERMAIELYNVCFLSKYQYHSDFFGTKNVLESTMELIHAQEEAQHSAIENGAKIRFIGAVDGMMKDETIDQKRKKFTEDNLSAKNKSGLMIYDATFRDLKQVTNQSYTIDNSEMERIKANVFDYFGVNEDILQNKFTEDTWDAYYEGKCEPFAIQLGDGLSHMLYTMGERPKNGISFSSNRLEYASNASKRNMVRDMVDRGIMSLNEAREILQMPPIEGGDIRLIRGEYILSDLIEQHTLKDALEAGQGTDAQREDNELPEQDYDYLNGDGTDSSDGSDKAEEQ